MKNMFFVVFALFSGFANAKDYFLYENKGFDVVAPSVYTVSDAPNEIGQIVHQSSDNVFYARGNGASDWQRLSNDVTTQVVAGVVAAYVGSTAPNGYLICDGSAVSRTTYADLYTVIGTKFGSGDGSTTFNLPDLRGKFIRGWDNSASNDPDASSRSACNTGGNTGDNIGSCQADELAAHTHTMSSSTATGADGGWFTTIHAPGGTGGPNTASTGGNETRPVNVTLNYIIKY